MKSTKLFILKIILMFYVVIINYGCSFTFSDKVVNGSNYKISYYTNGNMEYKSEYKNGKLNGVTKYWDENKNLISEAIYSNGKLHGLWVSYFENGKIKSKVNYYYGSKDGKEEVFYSTGQRKSITKYNEGKIVSKTMRWTMNGDLIQ